MRLTPRIHDRDVAGLTYVYPVVSRRSRGVSVGINLNPNNACNWRCRYCQVPGLVFGKGPAIDLDLLRRELDQMLRLLVRGDYLERHVAPELRRINDLAFSGNGEPTSSPQFAAAVDVAAAAAAAYPELAATKLVLITNGSLIHERTVQEGVARLARARGEMWFKLDSATEAGQLATNGSHLGVERTARNLALAASLCPTWLQTIVFAVDGAPPSEEEVRAWLALVAAVLADGVALRGVHLYGLARPSHQPEAERLSPVASAWFAVFAARIRWLGLEVQESP
ncbi:MAG: radical SAM protein [Planctomycetota bacterium]